MIAIKDLSFKYSGRENYALKNINLNIEDGDFVGIIGGSGAGKTTLTYVLNGIVPHHYGGDFYGEVLVNGSDTVDSSPEELSKSVGSVFQDIDSQMVSTIVEDEILFGLENFNVPRETIGERLEDALEKVGISKMRYRTIDSLSGGEKQKVAICAILAMKPRILILDEPTAELDPQSSRQIFRILKELNEKEGLTVVIVEQKIMLLSEFAKRLVVMESGNIRFDDSVREVLKHSDELYRSGVNCPRVATLSDRLSELGLYRGQVPLNVMEAETMVRGILK